MIVVAWAGGERVAKPSPSHNNGEGTSVKRLMFGILAGAIVFGAVFAFAASLNVGTTTLGAGDKAVTTCDVSDNTVNASYSVVYDSTVTGPPTGAYRVSTATIGGMDWSAADGTKCDGKQIRVTLSNNADANKNVELQGVVHGTSIDLGQGSLVPGFPKLPLAQDVDAVHVSLNG